MQNDGIRRIYSRDVPDQKIKGKWSNAISLVNRSKQQEPLVDIVIPKHVSKNDFVKWETRVDAAHVRQIERIALQQNYELLQKSLASQEFGVKKTQEYKTKFKWKRILKRVQTIDDDQESLDNLNIIGTNSQKVPDMIEPKFDLLVPLKVGDEPKKNKNLGHEHLKNDNMEIFIKKKPSLIRRVSGAEAIFSAGERMNLTTRRKSDDSNIYNTIKNNLPNISIATNSSVIHPGILANKYTNKIYKYFKS